MACYSCVTRILIVLPSLYCTTQDMPMVDTTSSGSGPTHASHPPPQRILPRTLVRHATHPHQTPSQHMPPRQPHRTPSHLSPHMMQPRANWNSMSTDEKRAFAHQYQEMLRRRALILQRQQQMKANVSYH